MSGEIERDAAERGLDGVLGATSSELEEIVSAMGHPAYRAAQIYDWIHAKGVTDPERMTNLPADLRAALSARPVVPATKGRVLRSKDGTRKLEVFLEDGAAVETVLIPEGDKLTQCVSSQVGCAVGCEFCRSGKFGLGRNLTTSEIIAQVVLAREEYEPGETLRNIVMMGVGEPLHNVERVARALDRFCDPDGMGLSWRRVTVSTVGVPRGIDRLGELTKGRAALAISLHASDDEVRRRLVPGVKATIAEIVAALRRYPLPRRMRYTIEYVMVKGVNDSDSDARNLVRVLSGLRVKINLLPINPHDLTDLEPPTSERVARFQEILVSKGMSAFLRKRRGDDINAACGQLLSPSSVQRI